MNENQAMMLERSMRSVFVGNIPFDLTEEKLREIFNEVGPVISFKLVYDRENGKPKGYGFCEYKDIETANSAMRNLNGYEIGGRVLKVDNAANEKNRVELQMAVTSGMTDSIMEPMMESVFEHMDPEKVPEAISKAVASLPPEQMFELMKQMKQCIQSNPHEARAMLLQNPQLAYGLLQSLVVMKIVDPEIALTMLSKPNTVPDLMNPEPRPVQPPPVRQDFPPQQMGHNMPPHMNNMQHPMNQNMPPQMNHNMPPQMNHNMLPQMNPNMPPQMNPNMQMNHNMPMHMNPNMNNMPSQMNQNVPPPIGNSDMDSRPMDPRNRMMSGPPQGMVSGDVDLRTQMPMPAMPPLPNTIPVPGEQARDPRQPPLPSQPPRDPRAGDPRSGPSAIQPPLPRQPPPLPKQKPAASSSQPMAGMAGMIGEGVSDQEKAQLIMQVLQLTSEQIAMLPAEQRQSILLLKEQIAKSKR